MNEDRTIETPQGVKPENALLNPAQAALERVLMQAPEMIRPNLMKLEELPLDEQAKTFKIMGEVNQEPEKFFMELYLARKLGDQRYQKRGLFFTDPLVHRVERGHKVAVMYEEPQEGGVSRHVARFLRELAEDEVIIAVDPNDPDIQALGIEWRTGGTPLRTSHSEKPGGQPLADAQGLYEMYMRDWMHPAFKTGETAKTAVEEKITDKCEMKAKTGIVRQAPREENEGIMILDDGTEIEMANVRFCALVGIDETPFLKRGQNEIYLHRPVRVWYKNKWLRGEINDVSAHGLLEIKCEEEVSDRKDFLGGHGLTIHSNSFDLDLRDPSLPEIKHPLQDYPLLRENNCVRYRTADGRLVLGYIEGIDVRNRIIIVDTPSGPQRMGFDDKYEVIDTPDSVPENQMLHKGNTFKVYDLTAGKYRVFEIKGIDKDNAFVIGRLVSLKPFGMPMTQVFQISGVELLGSPETVLEKHPYLRGAYKKYDEVTVRFKKQGRVLQGKVLTAETLPAFVEIIIEKRPHPKGPNADIYDRYDVPPEDLMGPVEKQK